MPFPLFPALRRSAPTVVNRPGDIHASNTPEPLHPYPYGFQQVEYRPANAKRPCHARSMRQRQQWPAAVSPAPGWPPASTTSVQLTAQASLPIFRSAGSAPHDGQPAYLAITILRLRGETSIAAFPAPPRAPGH